ncbi:effector-associated constant component EACC1 [Streptomyces liliifuscus]|uniref:Uncharacterized protein n=1 Tax=Streptomyces liliifuscus TaxID=2797636 RepID=A0A7T7I5V2_9ACTN|nr:hypothetical protein [Streptomyces liliifuscus]QQM41610.1 hypothetical protein JEQ17_20555 [Streptomyces liliifuscus]
MKLVVEAGSPASAADELVSLADWLRHEDELRGRIGLERAKIEEGRMGGLPEAVVVALSGGGAATVLARAAVEWVKQRRSDVVLKAVRPNGETYEIEVRGTRSPEELISGFHEFVQRNQAAADNYETP